MKYFEDLTRYLEQQKLAKPVGCSDHEISELESNLGCSLPEAFREYLLLKGKDYDGVMIGTNCFISDIELNNEYLPNLLEENGVAEYTLPNNYVTFFSHQGYMMAWFALPNEKSDPLVTYFGSSEESVGKSPDIARL